MSEPAAIAPVAPVVQIGIKGLTNLTNNMVGGGLYILIAETPSARFPMLAGNLGSALSNGLTCTLIVHSNPELFIQRIESFERSIRPQLILENRLQVFEMQEEFAKTMFRFGAEGFVRELENFEIPENSYLVFDQADELLSLHDISLALDQVEVLGKWLDQRKITALLAFTRVTEAHSDAINALMDSLTGIVRLGGNRDGLELTFDYWQSPEGTIAARSYRLSTLDSGLYEAAAHIAPSEQGAGEDNSVREEEPEDAIAHFIYMDPDLGSLAKQMQGNWQRVDTPVAMMHATRLSRSATCILTYQQDTNLRQLSETIHTLRLSLGRRAHIVVQEKGASLRYQNEALLLRLGVDLVVHKDVLISRLPLLLESLRGQIFNRDVNINFEAALTSVTPTRLRGYLLPLRFAREVDMLLDRAETLSIPCAMIIGKPAEDLTMADILGHINLSRSGDLITADNQYCYLFLNACPQSVMLTTLERLLGRAVDTALNDLRFLVQRIEINSEMLALTRAADHGDLPDYSALSEPVAAPAEAPTAGVAQAKPLVNPATDTARPAAPAAAPIAKLIDAWAPSEAKNRDVKDRPGVPAAAKAAPQVGQIPVPPPVFGKKEAPRATRAKSPIDSANVP